MVKWSGQCLGSLICYCLLTAPEQSHAHGGNFCSEIWPDQPEMRHCRFEIAVGCTITWWYYPQLGQVRRLCKLGDEYTVPEKG